MSKMPVRTEFSFVFDHITHGPVTVEALYTIQEGDVNERDSDVDYNGFHELEHYAVFKAGKQIILDIHDDVLYHHLRNHLRNTEIEGCFMREEEF